MCAESAKNRILIAGCGRSGTTLLLKLMRAFEDTYAVAREARVEAFEGMRDRLETNIVLKRTADSRFDLPEIEPDIRLVYCLRHPLDVLTSKLRKPGKGKRRLPEYYITPLRWVSEYNALNRLRLVQRDRQIHFVRYEDLVQTPDIVQRKLSSSLNLLIWQEFSKFRSPPRKTSNVAASPSTASGNISSEVRQALEATQGGVLIQNVSIRKWEKDERKRDYLYSLAMEFRRELQPFCNEFDYDLPDDFVRL